MTRPTGARLTLAVAIAVGLSFTVAPQMSSAAPGADVPTDRAPLAAIGEHLWPVDALALPSTLARAVPVPVPAPADVAVPAPAPAAVAAEPEVDVTPEPAPIPDAAPAPAEEATVAGTIHVDVTTTADATRTVTVQTADGTVVAGPVLVDGDRLTFAGLADGTYDVLAEQRFDTGGSFVTRTVVEVAGGETVLTCDAESLDCTVS